MTSLPISLIKIPFIVFDAFWMLLAATPPNPPRPSKEHIVPNWRERFLKLLATPGHFLRVTYWTACIIEILVLLATIEPTHAVSQFIISTFVWNAPASATRLRITNTFVLGSILTCFGTLLRLRCYKTLGKLFSFELCIHADHQLIDTGPYSVIRHPSYTGLILTIVGAYLNQIQGSWVSECGLVSHGSGLGMVLVVLWVILSSFVIVSLLLRIPNEDALLKEKFGDEWALWAKNVPYCLIPGVY